MATFYSDLATYQASTDPTTRNSFPAIQNMPEKLLDVSYTLAGTEVANDVIVLALLPKGARVIAERIAIYCADPGTALTLDIGDDDNSTAADDNRYVAALDVKAGGFFQGGSAPGVAVATRYTTGKSCWLQVKVNAADTLTATTKIRITIPYVTL